MLRSTRRGLETWHGRDGVTLADKRASQQGTQTSTYTGAPVLDPTDERGWETGRWPKAPSYRTHPRLYRSGHSQPVLERLSWPDEDGAPAERGRHDRVAGIERPRRV